MRDSNPQDFAPAVPENVEFFPFDILDDEHDDDDCDEVTQVPFLRGGLPEDFVPCGGRKDDSEGLLDGWFGSDEDDKDVDEKQPRKKKKKSWFWDLFD